MKNKIEGGFSQPEKNKDKESIKITNYLSKMLKSDRLSQAIDKTNEGVNLFSKPTSENKEMFLRILKPEERLILAASEEHIPKKDKNGNWIDSTDGAKKIDFKEVTPTPDLVPDNLDSEIFLSNFKHTLSQMGDLDEGETYTLADENFIGREPTSRLSDKEVKEILEEVMDQNKK